LKLPIIFPFFYLFLDGLVLPDTTMLLGQSNTPEHRRKMNGAQRNLFFEERSGGVAAIDPPPQDGNGA
jgi:hypothetical protein